MSLCEMGFWCCLLLIVYPYLLYPLTVAMLARLFGRSVQTSKPKDASLQEVSILVCAYNEQANVERRIMELLALLNQPHLRGELIVVTDGSTDDTVAIVRRLTDQRVRLLELPQRIGKAAALTHAASHARYEILVFADVRQTWESDALERLLENFNDARVGAVSGDLVVRAKPGTLAGVGIYWKYEKWIRRNESALWAQVGVTGAISACRRSLFEPIPAGMILDDVFWPLRVAMKGYRVVNDRRAVAYDRLPERTRDEFRRKVRTLAGNFQLAVRLPQAMLPWRNPIWFQFVSHKLARLLVPWSMLGLLTFSACSEDPLYHAAFLLQIAGYFLGLVGLQSERGGKILSAAGSFLVLNAAAWVAFWVWVTGRAGSSWGKVKYDGTRLAVPS